MNLTALNRDFYFWWDAKFKRAMDFKPEGVRISGGLITGFCESVSVLNYYAFYPAKFEGLANSAMSGYEHKLAVLEKEDIKKFRKFRKYFRKTRTAFEDFAFDGVCSKGVLIQSEVKVPMEGKRSCEHVFEPGKEIIFDSLDKIIENLGAT